MVTIECVTAAFTDTFSCTGLLTTACVFTVITGVAELPGVPVIAKSEKPVDSAEKQTVPSFAYSTVVGKAVQPFAVWWYSMILPGAM